MSEEIRSAQVAHMRGVRQRASAAVAHTGLRVAFVKSRAWPRQWWSVRCKCRRGQWPQHYDGQAYVVAHPDEFRRWHESPETQVLVLHELGHLLGAYRWHWLDETMASVRGWRLRRALGWEHLGLRYLLWALLQDPRYLLLGRGQFAREFCATAVDRRRAAR